MNDSLVTSLHSNHKQELADYYDFCMVLPVDEKTDNLTEKGNDFCFKL